MRTTPFWLDDHPHPSGLGTGELPAETDVLVVGAGYTGLAAARELSAAGLHTTLVDARAVGEGASGINGGQLNIGLKAGTKELFAGHGPEVGRRLWDASLEAIDLVEEIVSAEAIDCDFARNGAAALAYRDGDLAALQGESTWMRERLGFDTEVIGSERMHEVVGSGHYACALVDDVGASIHPAKYVHGLALAVEESGAVIVERNAVTGIDRTTSGFEVETERGTTRAGTVLMATNGYTPPDLVPAIRRTVVPVGSYMVATEPLGRDVAEELLPGNRVAWTVRRLLHYFRRSPDDRLLMGGRRNLATGLDLRASAAELRAAIDTIFPQARDAAITHTWGGAVGVTFDLLPHIGRRDGVWFALGYGGHGVALGTYVGREAGRIISGTQQTSPFATIPARQRFYYRKRPWFLPVAAAGYRVLDRLGR